MDIIIVPLLQLVATLLNLYKLALFANVVITLLIQFKVINVYHRFVITLSNFLFKVTEPILSVIRRFVPSIGGFDLSPLIALLGVSFLEHMVIMMTYSFYKLK